MDWKEHKKDCDPDPILHKLSWEKKLHFEDFELIWDIGQGNFSRILLVVHKDFKRQYALKMVEKQWLKALRKETDIIWEKQALNKLAETYKDLPRFVKLVTTFSDETCLYLLMENL